MILYCLFFSLCSSNNETHCNDVLLLPGQICCNNLSCDGYCYEYDSRVTTNGVRVVTHHEVCLSTDDQFWCLYPAGLFTFALIFMAPNILTLIISNFLPRSAPTVSFIQNFVVNLCMAIVLTAIICIQKTLVHSILYLTFGSLGWFFGFFFFRCNICHGGPECSVCCHEPVAWNRRKKIMQVSREAIRSQIHRNPCCDCCMNTPNLDHPNNCTCCDCEFCDEPNDIVGVIRELKSPHISKAELSTVISENAMIPPTPTIVGNAFRMTGKNKSQKQVTFTLSEDVSYVSWQEIGKQVVINDSPIIVFRCISEYQFDPVIEKSIESQKVTVREKVQGKSDFYEAYEETETTGMTYGAIAADNTCLVDCCTSGFVKNILFNLLMFFGYHSILETIWRSNVEFVEFHSVKQVSGEEGLRARAGERDREAGNIVQSASINIP